METKLRFRKGDIYLYNNMHCIDHCGRQIIHTPSLVYITNLDDCDEVNATLKVFEYSVYTFLRCVIDKIQYT